MTILLKINAARRLSGSEGRRPALSFSSYRQHLTCKDRR